MYHRFTPLPAAFLLASLWACEPPPVDDFRSAGGLSPDPSGRITGTLVYIGPKPKCEYRQGWPARVRGRTVLTLFLYDNPPPPSGTATRAESLLVVPGRDLFALTDCLPESPTADDRAKVLTRSAPFDWPSVPLDEQARRTYQLRGYFDRDEDTNPFFRVRNLPTAGDIAGAALADPTDPRSAPLAIGLPPKNQATAGTQVPRVTVFLAQPIWTERPAFRLDPETRPLAANATFPLSPDPLTSERALWELSRTRLQLLNADRDADSLAAAGVELAFGQPHYAFFSEPVDTNGDGEPDPHPVLGPIAGVPWRTPLMILQRTVVDPAAAASEAAAHIPAVQILGSVRPSQTSTKRVFAPSIDMLIPPLAIVHLDPSRPECRVSYLPPHNPAPLYEGSPTVCSKLPTGRYSVQVLAGVVGGRPTSGNSSLTDTGLLIENGQYSGQAWSLPNELGDPRQLAVPAALNDSRQTDVPGLSHQGPQGLFVVRDPDVNAVDTCEQGPDPLTGTVRPIRRVHVPLNCCQAVAHLCNVPLCAAQQAPGGNGYVRASPTRVRNGIPNCVPFAIPEECCGSLK